MTFPELFKRSIPIRGSISKITAKSGLQTSAEILLSYQMPENQRRLLDGIIAPEFSAAAVEMLKRKGDKCRFLVNPALASLSKSSLDEHARLRYVRGGFLMQPNYNFILDLSDPNAPNSTRMPRIPSDSGLEIYGNLSQEQKLRR